MANWMKCVSDMGTWFGNNVTTYQKAASNKVSNRNAYPLIYLCPLINEKVRDDCSGFVSACLIYAGVMKKGSSFNAASFASTSGACADLLRAGGFTPMNFNSDILQEGDIYAHSGHVEICAGKDSQWGWGNTHYQQMPCKTGYASPWTSKSYTTIWRLGGDATNSEGIIYNGSIGSTGSISSGSGGSSIGNNEARPIMGSRGSNTVYNLSSAGTSANNYNTVEENRRNRFSSIAEEFSNNAPELGRDIVISNEMIGAEKLKSQDAKKYIKNE